MDAKNLKIGYIGGGSKDWAWKLMNDLALESKLGGEVALYDIDTKSAEDNARLGMLISSAPQSISQWRYRVAEQLEDCLTGADLVIVSIMPGTFEEMRADVHIPEQYGLYQSVGDTVGPAGILRALRCVPMYEVIAGAIARICPNAWVINYTNPMSVCTRALYRIFPKIKAFGCCHEVFSTQEILQQVVRDSLGVEAARHEIDITVLGINHFTWLTQARYQNIDLAPLYREWMKRYEATGYPEDNAEKLKSNPFSSAHLVKFDLFRHFGYYAAAGDRHLAEFTSTRYLINPAMVARWKFGLTSVDYRIQNRKDRTERNQRLVDGVDPLDITHSGEEGVSIIKALAGVEPLVTNMNLPNQGQVANLPLGAIVETNAYLRGDTVQPVFAGTMPQALADMTLPFLLNQNAIVDAALSKDREAAINVFVNDPMVRRLGDADARTLFDKMEAAQLSYMPWNIQ